MLLLPPLAPPLCTVVAVPYSIHCRINQQTVITALCNGYVAIAKNYLSAEELTALDRVVTMYLDYAEDQASKRKPMTMADWAAKLDSFLQFNERNVLSHTGRISHELAVQHANAEFERYDAEVRRIEAAQPTSDFDHLVEVSKEVAKALPSGTQAGRAKKKQ